MYIFHNILHSHKSHAFITRANADFHIKTRILYIWGGLRQFDIYDST